MLEILMMWMLIAWLFALSMRVGKMIQEKNAAAGKAAADQGDKERHEQGRVGRSVVVRSRK